MLLSISDQKKFACHYLETRQHAMVAILWLVLYGSAPGLPTWAHMCGMAARDTALVELHGEEA